MPKKVPTPDLPKSQTAVYRAHRNLKQAIKSPSSPRYPHMGGLGVTLPKSWETFDGFIAAVGMPPDDEHTVPMRANLKQLAFSAKNFKWGTAAESRLNRVSTTRYPYKGKDWTAAELAAEYDINLSTLRTRLRSGWSVKEAIQKDKK